MTPLKKPIQKLLFYPDNLNIIDFIKKDKLLTEEEKAKCIEYEERFLYPISKIILESRLNKKYEEDDFVSLSSRILNKLFGSPFNSNKMSINIMAFYVRNNILKKRNYKKGVSNNSYKLNDNYLNEHYKSKPITDTQLNSWLNDIFKPKNETVKYIMNNLEDLNIDLATAKKTLRKKIKEKHKEFKINNNKISKKSSYVYTSHNEVLSEGIFSKIKDKYSQDYIQNYLDGIDALFTIEDDKKIKNVISNWKMNIEKIAKQDWDKSDSKKSGRIFNNVTSLPRELRNCLFLNNGEILTEIDIKNSQPFLFNILLQENFNLEKDIFQDKLTDVVKYMKLTKEGSLYDYLIEKWGVKIERDAFKKLFFKRVFYCQTKSNYRYVYSKLFAKEFPNVFKLIIKMKEGNYKNLSIQLQKRESDIVIRRIGNELMKRNIWFVTVHDSVICRKSDSILVKQIFEKEFKKLHLYPTLNVKDLK